MRGTEPFAAKKIRINHQRFLNSGGHESENNRVIDGGLRAKAALPPSDACPSPQNPRPRCNPLARQRGQVPRSGRKSPSFRFSQSSIPTEASEPYPWRSPFGVDNQETVHLGEKFPRLAEEKVGRESKWSRPCLRDYAALAWPSGSDYRRSTHLRFRMYERNRQPTNHNSISQRACSSILLKRAQECAISVCAELPLNGQRKLGHAVE
jgi:hypothetical protein